MVYNDINAKPEKLLSFCLFFIVFVCLYLKYKFRNLMEQNSLLLQYTCKENINININKKK